MTFFGLIFIGAIIATFFLMDVDIPMMFSAIAKSFNKSPTTVLFILLILLFPILKSVGMIMVVRPKLKDMGFKISWLEYISLTIKLIVLNCITPFATGSEPYLIYWITSRTGSIKLGNLISLINGIGGNIAETLITIPAFIIVSMHYDTLTTDLNGMIVYWFVVGGLCINILVLSFFIFLALSKKMHYFISLCSNWILKKMHRKYLTKQEIYQKYIVEAEFRNMVVEVFKQWKYLTLSAVGYAIYSLYFYLTMVFSFVVGTGDFNFFNNSEGFFGLFNIANVSITASNFIPVPNGEGTIPLALSVLLHNFFNNDPSINVFINEIPNSVMIWRLFTTYVPLIGLIVVMIVYYSAKLSVIRKMDNEKLMKQQEQTRNKVSFSFIVPLYNCAQYVCETIESILNCGYEEKKIQIVVIDDGSTDDSLKVLKKYGKKIQVVSKKNGNWGSVINYAVKNIKLTGDYVTVLDSDDIMELNALTWVSESPQADVIFGNFNKWAEGRKKEANLMWGGSKLIKDINKARTPYSQPLGKFYKKELFIKAPVLREGISFQDGHLFHGLLSQAKDVYYINKPLASWRLDRIGNSTSAKWNEVKTEQFVINYQDVADNGGLSIALIQCIAPSFRKSIAKYSYRVDPKGQKPNYEWFPSILIPLVKMVIGVCGVKRAVLTKPSKNK